MSKRSAVLVFAVATIVSVPAAEALAVKRFFRVGPHDKDISVTARRTADGHIDFTVRRDPKASRFAQRDAALNVYDASGLVASCPVAHSMVDNLVTYRFTVSPRLIDRSTFVLTEVQADGEQSGGGGRVVVGGGEIYEVPLREFSPGRPAQ